MVYAENNCYIKETTVRQDVNQCTEKIGTP